MNNRDGCEVGTPSVRHVIKRAVPRPLLPAVRRVQHFLAGCGWRIPPKLAPLPEDASPELALAHRAWEVAARSEGNQLHICYYSLSFEGFMLPGERPWAPRWALLSRKVCWQEARVLELGSNIGLLSTFALRAGAARALMVDYDETLLEAGRLLQQAFHVNGTRVRCDFNDDGPWEDALAEFHPTVAVALSVLNWVRDKQRFLRFLGRFETVLYEGHESMDIERRRLAWAGFTDIELLGCVQYKRPVFVARAGAAARHRER